ncbi:hypothetical protein P3T18_003066 [Paraburkholderia sp. GAS199]|uniref:hypothetical protein n=1 Tax=Paraburkholderia sp. GAS199 TaxID=3035126 RepID=UPI003D1B7F0C
MAASNPGHTWLELVKKNPSSEFSEAFAPDVLLEASVLRTGLIGTSAIGQFFSATSGMYDCIDFTYESNDGNKTYLEWEGKALGDDVAGSTTLTRNDAGRIVNIRLHHRPFPMVVKISAELAKRLDGKV